jgi:DNA-binding ferritin-like protein
MDGAHRARSQNQKVSEMTKQELVKSLEQSLADARKRADAASYNNDPREYYSLNELVTKLERELWRHC